MRNNLTKKDIINSIYMQLGYSKKVSENILDDFINEIVNSIALNKKVKISNFGTFSLKRKKSRVGRNPKTKEKKIIKERNVILFKPSIDLKKYVNKIDG